MITYDELLILIRNTFSELQLDTEDISAISEKLDSLSIMHLIILIEEKTSYTFTIEDLSNIRNLADMLRILEKDKILR